MICSFCKTNKAVIETILADERLCRDCFAELEERRERERREELERA